MKFVSLRGSPLKSSISEAIVAGLAPDGGLYVPEHWPDLHSLPTAIDAREKTSVKNSRSPVSREDFENEWVLLPFPQFAARLLAPFFAGDPLAVKLEEICKIAFDFPVVLKELGDGKTLLELFHGPTGAFKDFGARFLALCMTAIPDPRAKDRLVLVATSGDTGGAVAAAFCSCTKIPVAILYPKNGVSFRQEKQLTVWGEQVRAFAVDGSFDDCQRIVKEALASSAWQTQHQLISANSINLARLLPQMAYFSFASLQYKRRHGVAPELIIPSGNMGNASAALWAMRLGFPIRHVSFAHNENRAVTNYFVSGDWQPLATVSTLANAMDVGNPSNFERVRKLFASDLELKKNASARSVTDEEIRKSVLVAKRKWNEVICPHTATAIFIGETLPAPHWIAAATAHPAKFESILEPLLGETIPVPAALQTLLNQKSTRTEIEPTLKSFTESWRVSNFERD